MARKDWPEREQKMSDMSDWLAGIDAVLYPYVDTQDGYNLACGIARAWLWPLYYDHSLEECLDYREVN